jgi:hypothetical protein
MRAMYVTDSYLFVWCVVVNMGVPIRRWPWDRHSCNSPQPRLHHRHTPHHADYPTAT